MKLIVLTIGMCLLAGSCLAASYLQCEEAAKNTATQDLAELNDNYVERLEVLLQQVKEADDSNCTTLHQKIGDLVVYIYLVKNEMNRRNVAPNLRQSLRYP